MIPGAFSRRTRNLMNATFAHPTTTNIIALGDRDYYLTRGYVVVRNVVPKRMIERLLSLYREQIVPSRHPFFRQNSNAYEPNTLSANGYVRQSFLDIHDYRDYPEFSLAARQIYCSEGLLASLARVTGFDSFSLMQTMLFDLNTATPAHQDWYYLDTVPNGNLVASWIALEDIDERAGRFFVLPGSHGPDYGAKEPGRTHANWLQGIGKHVDEHSDEVVAPALNAGDVLFWNSRTIHGSLRTQDESFSRKSLTAHYLPGGFEFGNLFAVKANVSYKTHEGVAYYRNQPDFSRWNQLKFGIKTRAYNYPVLRETLRTARDLLGRRRPKAS